MNLSKIFRVVKKLAPVVITYGPLVAAAVKEVKQATKRMPRA